MTDPLPFARPEPPGNARLLRPLQARAVALLVEGRSMVEVAEALAVNERTVRRWRELPGFKDALREARDSAFRSALDELRVVGGEAVRVLRALLADSDPRVRLSAARTVVVGMLNVNEHVSIAAQLAEVIARLDARDARGPK